LEHHRYKNEKLFFATVFVLISVERQKSNTIYFPGLNSLRFIAAAVVMICHTSTVKDYHFGISPTFSNNYANQLSHLAVVFFFVLSGFLITYLLLDEKKENSKINTWNFYRKRMLRIWPLYFLIIIAGLFILPNIQLFSIPSVNYSGSLVNELPAFQTILYLAVLPNIAEAVYASVPFVSFTWSIGVEEQFYIFWPFVVQKSKHILAVLIIILVVMVLLSSGFLSLAFLFLNNQLHLFPASQVAAFNKSLTHFITYFKIGSMAIGGIGAWLLYYHKSKVELYLGHKLLNVVVLGSLFCLLVFNISYSAEFYSLFFVWIILSTATGNFFVNLEVKWLSYLRKISYGIYMYHMFVILFAINLLGKTGFQSGRVVYNTLLHTGVIAGTILVAMLSYTFFEKKILSLK
jgi:peptidoglycan/LPS O-acetylase OafA/YrhL